MSEYELPGDDDDLMDYLRTLADKADPVPDLVDEAARLALVTRRLDAEFAELLADSTLDASPVRADDAVRLVLLASTAVTVDLQLTDRPDGTVDLRGLVDGASGDVVVEWNGGRRTAGIQEFGEFVMDALPPATFRLRLVGDDGSPVLTSWVTG